MINKLTTSDEAEVADLLKQEVLLNVFILSYLEHYGLENDFMGLWGDYDSLNHLRGVMLRFGNTFLPYAEKESFDVEAFAAILNDQKQLNMCGPFRVTEKFEKHLPLLKKRRKMFYFAKCANASMINTNPEVIIRIAVPDEVEKIIAMRKEIPEFRDRNEDTEEIIKQLKKGLKRIYYIEQDHKIVSVVDSAAENAFSTMISGVSTLEGYRGKGFAKTLVKRLCCDLLAAGKTPCLLYQDPEADKMYHQVGFENIGKFAVYR